MHIALISSVSVASTSLRAWTETIKIGGLTTSLPAGQHKRLLPSPVLFERSLFAHVTNIWSAG